MPTLKAQVRTVFGKRTKTLRKEGKVPAVIYGHGVQTLPLEVSAREFEQVYKEAGENTLLTLEITKDGKAEPRNVIIHEVVHDPLKDHVLHVDFYQVRMDEKVATSVPVVFEGEAPAVKALGGVLVKPLHELEIEALPKDLPHEILVDISKLETFEDRIRVKDLAVPAGVSVKHDPEETLALVEPPRTEAELKALEEEVVEAVGEVKVEAEEKKEAKAEEAAPAEEAKPAEKE